MKIEDVTLQVVKKEKLKDFVDIILPENEELHIDKFAIYKNMYGIDIDCCFWELKPQYINGKIQPVIEIECRIKKYKGDGKWSLRMDKPDFVKVITLQDYIYLSEEIKMTDFIRYNYNPRIISNQNLFLKHLKSQEK